MTRTRFSLRFLALAAPLACGGTSSPANAPAPAAVAPRAGSAAIDEGDLRRHLEAYSHDSMLGREAGELGNYRATTYIGNAVQRLGLEPAGDGGTFFQSLPMGSMEVDPKGGLIVGATTLRLWLDYAPLSPTLPGVRAAGLAAQFDGIPTVYGGRLSDTLRALAPAQIEGKFVVVSAALGPNGQPTWQMPPQALARFRTARAIAVANLDVAPPMLVEFMKQSSPTVGDGPPPVPFPLIMLTSERAAGILLGAPIGSLAPGAAGPQARGSVRFVRTPVQHPARNVVAVVRGSDPALRNEYVAIGAHNDHIGLAEDPVDHDSMKAFNRVVRPQGADDPEREAKPEEWVRIRAILDSLRRIRPPRPDSVYNGADDDGSGTVTLLEIAEALAAANPRPKRSILFVWHTGEELGLFGSEWFTDHPTVPLTSIVAQLNLDMVGRGEATDLKGGGPGYLQVIGSRRLSTELGDLVEGVNRTGRHGLTFDYQYDANGHPQQYYCRSDHYNYARFGIPVAFFSSGGHQDYHQLTDEVQYISFSHLARVARFVGDLATQVANLDHRLVIDKPKPDPRGDCVQ